MAPRYEVHGRFELRREGDLLFLDLHGPWNMECIREAAAQAWPIMLDIQSKGPVGVIVAAHGSMLGTMDAVQAIREETGRRGQQNRMAVAWVAEPSVEGRQVMAMMLQQAYEGLVAFESFDSLSRALTWIREKTDAWRAEAATGV
ncbi:MAG TPA: hypothetical protein VFB36_09155 [Nevskiaceae bacterium]|nr:hypothetical protein [Nevskiaceae bacterium]